MALRPVQRQSVSDQVFDQVLSEVVDGELAAGDALPSERRLAEVLGVSRPAVREALQRIAQTGVVEVRHGGTTTVRDFHRHAGLDLLPRLMVRGQKLDVAIARSVVEARTQIAPGIAALAAERGGPAVTAPLGEVLDRLATTTDAVLWQREVLEFWDVVVDAGDSLVYRLMFNSLRSAYEPAVPVLAAWLEAEVGLLDPYRVLATAIAAGDPGTARAAAERVLAPTARALMTALDVAGEEAR
ncbi:MULTISPECIES: FadR/GntR family transcriptional regulator [unclassified Dietzia]|uniref:FadR/GntR family transcriptional regulator n=3 Tax=Dietzia TaxID=37914 RepID=UPI000D2188D7|nr:MULTISPECIES: GntR family transcriptional regulator [unclassified Dietzia]AVZ40828.1 GntR family transcriptional regulator [Dietzia sp. JS16-p6b]